MSNNIPIQYGRHMVVGYAQGGGDRPTVYSYLDRAAVGTPA